MKNDSILTEGQKPIPNVYLYDNYGKHGLSRITTDEEVSKNMFIIDSIIHHNSIYNSIEVDDQSCKDTLHEMYLILTEWIWIDQRNLSTKVILLEDISTEYYFKITRYNEGKNINFIIQYFYKDSIYESYGESVIQMRETEEALEEIMGGYDELDKEELIELLTKIDLDLKILNR